MLWQQGLLRYGRRAKDKNSLNGLALPLLTDGKTVNIIQADK